MNTALRRTRVFRLATGFRRRSRRSALKVSFLHPDGDRELQRLDQVALALGGSDRQPAHAAARLVPEVAAQATQCWCRSGG